MAELAGSAIVQEGYESQEKGKAENIREAIISKIGYLVIESCLDQIENVVGRNIERFKLNYHAKLPLGIFSNEYAPKEPVIIVKIDIAIPKRNITGHMLCSLTHKAANRMADGLDALVVESIG
jgi:hypothetical protein